MHRMHEILKPYVEKGLLSYQKHPTRDLHLYNYTQTCQFERAWDENTLMCRGLILNGEGKIVARCFPKFFNYEEHQGPLPNGEPEIYEKVDGSLLIASLENGYSPIFATRGSFVSEQAQWAEEHMLLNYGIGWMEPEFTYLFEIIYPENRIVVDYGDRKDLVLLAKINTKTGEEADISFAHEWRGPRARRFLAFSKMSIDELKAQDFDNFEGYVLFWREAGLRLKLKFSSYVALHRILTGVHARHVWEFMRDGQSLAPLIERTPDEFHQWLLQTHDAIFEDYERLVWCARKAYDFRPPHADRREFAAWAATKPPELRPLLFAMLDGKPLDSIIWKQIKPEASRPFRAA